jgi:hypothetical protein
MNKGTEARMVTELAMVENLMGCPVVAEKTVINGQLL